MYVVSGCPRSGTSLMMDIFRESLGEDRIIGRKFPREERLVRRGGETEPMLVYRQYVQQLQDGVNPEETRDLNPDGFWECPFTVQGVAYRPRVGELIKRIGAEDEPSVCKVVSQGLYQSNPIYIDAVIYMLRAPEAVAKSQERLRRRFMVKHPDTNNPQNLFQNMVIQTPQMFIDVTLQGARWLSKNKEIPLYIVKYNDVVYRASHVLRKLGKALGENLMNGIYRIRPELNRSSNIRVEHPLMEEAEQVYTWFLRRQWTKLREYQVDRTTLQNKQQQQWFCVRSASMTQESLCTTCFTDSSFRDQLRVDAEQRGWDWTSQPCAFECAYDTRRTDFMSLSESVEHNHWGEVG